MNKSSSFSEVFRPKKVAQLIGDDQRRIAQGLLDQIEKGNYAQEIMFIGPTGTGKTTLVRMCAAAIIQESEPEIIELNCGNDTGVEAIRDWIRSMQYYSIDGNKSIYHLAEIHNLTKNAQEAMLTEIEPVPEHVILFASTTDFHRLLPTLSGRFEQHFLTVPSEEWFKKKAHWMSNGKQLDQTLVEEIVYSCNGSVREFDKKIQQALAGTYKAVQLEVDDPKNLLNMMIYQSVTLQDWFEAATRETEYIGFAIGICGYCIKILSNKKSNPKQFIRAQIILSVLGKGLSRDTSAKVSFHQKLLEIYSEFQNLKERI